ncbi:MAG: hypothetical protein O2913_13475 [Chloroflexi bacterium]|nr:hypothetical protein [Chloroflexota bacterium]
MVVEDVPGIIEVRASPINQLSQLSMISSDLNHGGYSVVQYIRRLVEFGLGGGKGWDKPEHGPLPQTMIGPATPLESIRLRKLYLRASSSSSSSVSF